MARKVEREQRYEQVLSLHRQGLRTSDIAIQVAMGERTVRDWLAHGTYPEPKHRRHRPSLVDRYEREVLKRWEQGDHNGASPCIGICGLKAIAARKKPSTAISPACARLVTGRSRRTSPTPLLDHCSDCQQDVPPHCFCADSQISIKRSKQHYGRSGKPVPRLRQHISWCRRFSR